MRDEFAKKVKRKHAALQDIRDVVEAKLQQMLGRNPLMMDYYRRYLEIVAEYNREKDRVTVEHTFAELVKLANSLDAEQRRAAEEGLSDDEYVLFQLLFKDNLSGADREKLKQASRSWLRFGNYSSACPHGRRIPKHKPRLKCSFWIRCGKACHAIYRPRGGTAGR